MLACFVGVVVWFGHDIVRFLAPPADTVTVPAFVGQTLGDATKEIARIQLTSHVIADATSDHYPKGIIINQRPDAGTTVRQGREVSFVVSDGLITRLMPDMRYQSMREVDLDLARVRLHLGTITYAKNDLVPQGQVVDQDPQPLSNVREGDRVNLVLSKGGSPALSVPNFVGMTIDAARTMARKSGVKLGQIVWTPLGGGAAPHGAVVRQSPSASAKIPAYTPVSLDVSAGPNESGYLLRQVHVAAAIPIPQNIAPGDSVVVRLRVHDATGSYDAYRAFAQPGQRLDFTVSTLGTSVVDLYVNNVLVGERRLGNEPSAVYNEKRSPTPALGAHR